MHRVIQSCQRAFKRGDVASWFARSLLALRRRLTPKVDAYRKAMVLHNIFAHTVGCSQQFDNANVPHKARGPSSPQVHGATGLDRWKRLPLCAQR